MSGFDFGAQRLRLSGPAMLFAGAGIMAAIIALGAMLGQTHGVQIGPLM